METEPYVLGIEELGEILHDQEIIGKMLNDQEKENMDNFILNEVLEQGNKSEQVQTDSEEAKRQSNQVCLYFTVL